MAVQRNYPVIPEVSRSVQAEFRNLRTALYDAQDQLQATTVQIQNLNPTSLTVNGSGSSNKNTSNSVVFGGGGGGSGSITSPGGANPNVSQLIGLLAQAQRAYIPEYDSVPILADPISQDGALVSVNEILYRFNAQPLPGEWFVQTAVGVLLEDTYASWTAANYDPTQYPPGTQFLISDWNVIYSVRVVATVNVWVYLSGTYQAAYSSLPTTGFDGAALGVNDKGLLFYDNVTYVRRWEWSGTAWSYASGELPGGDTSPAIMLLAGNTTPPGWAACAGGSVTITTALATTVSFTVPAFNSGYYPKGGSYSATPVAVLNPVIGAITPTGTIAVTASLTGSSPAQSGTGASIPTGVSIDSETFTGNAVTPAVSVAGEPEHISIPYYIKL